MEGTGMDQIEGFKPSNFNLVEFANAHNTSVERVLRTLLELRIQAFIFLDKYLVIDSVEDGIRYGDFVTVDAWVKIDNELFKSLAYNPAKSEFGSYDEWYQDNSKNLDASEPVQQRVTFQLKRFTMFSGESIDVTDDDLSIGFDQVFFSREGMELLRENATDVFGADSREYEADKITLLKKQTHVSGIKTSKFSDRMSLKWSDISMNIVGNGDVLLIKVGNESEKMQYGECGFADSRSNKPNRLWSLLYQLAGKNSLNAGANVTDKDISDLRKNLRALFPKIDSSKDPLPRVETGVWKPSFQLSVQDPDLYKA